MALVASLFFSQSRVFALNQFAITNFSDTLFDKMSAVGSVKDIVTTYCSTVLGASAFEKNDFVYDGKQSAFVHLLCSNVAGQSSSFFTTTPSYFARTSFGQLWFQTVVANGESEIEYCQSMNNECDLATNLPNLFNAIISDYVNMKQSNIYGLTLEVKDDNVEGQINAFSSGYFDGIQACAKEGRMYPKTCSMMKWYIKNARNLLSDVRIFSGVWVLEMQKKLGSASCAVHDWNYNILLCGLYGTPANSFVPFVNLTYNELFYYRLFLWYYFAALQKNPWILVNTAYNNNLTTIMHEFSSQYTRSKDALTLTFRMLRDTNMAFPFHVGFSLYQEDLDGFGKLMARIAPPMYTLYDKLRNVQKPQ